MLPFSATIARGLAAVLCMAAAGAAAGDAALGERIYQEGLLPSGQPVEAMLRQGLPLAGLQAACSACHRRSGFGSGEGFTPIRPVTGRYLFQATSTPNPNMYRAGVTSPGMRPAYDDASLARALRVGVDPAGRELDGMMPRYQLDEDAIDHLTAYLKTLSVAPDPGVSDTQLHFATIVDAASDPARRKVMLEILETFFRDKNAGTRLEGERARRTPWDQARTYKAYRKWTLHVWTLEGPPATWAEQLEAHYRKQPVFAMLSGLGSGDWQPVHDFCEGARLPCIFPNVDLPPQTPGNYALYLSRGLAMEAEALALHLARNDTRGTVVQVYRDDLAAAARAFRAALSQAGGGEASDRVLTTDAVPDAAYWQEISRLNPATLVLWLRPKDLESVAALAPFTGRLYLSSRLAGQPDLPDVLVEQAAFVYPWELPERLAPRLLRLHAWLRARHIPLSDDPIQANTFFAVTQATMAIPHLVDDYSRDYFIERIEHGMDNTLAPSAYPRPSLGPGQRFASKGAYIARQAPAGLEAEEEWIVP